MDELSKRRKWRRWLALIETEVDRLQEEYEVYLRLREHLEGHARWVSLLDHLYLVGVSLAVRRLADANPRHRTVSLVKLLKEMEAHPDCVSRRTVLQRAKAAHRSEVGQLFDHLAGEGAAHIPPAVLRQWREELEMLAVPFRRWVDHRVAHHDLAAEGSPPDLLQVQHVLNLLLCLLTRLKLLVGA
jgi:hypothetical protein